MLFGYVCVCSLLYSVYSFVVDHGSDWYEKNGSQQKNQLLSATIAKKSNRLGGEELQNTPHQNFIHKDF